MARILIFVLFVAIVIAVYATIHIYIRGKIQDKKDKAIVAKSKPLEELTQQYHNIDPDLQEWFALNSATALGMTVEEFMVATKTPPKIQSGVPVNVIYGGNKGTVMVPLDKVRDKEYLISAMKRTYPDWNLDLWQNFQVEYDVDQTGKPQIVSSPVWTSDKRSI